MTFKLPDEIDPFTYQPLFYLIPSSNEDARGLAKFKTLFLTRLEQFSDEQSKLLGNEEASQNLLYEEQMIKALLSWMEENHL